MPVNTLKSSTRGVAAPSPNPPWSSKSWRMADVFISYAREDRAYAERLAAAFAERHVSVWWDRSLKGGSAFHDEIERELQAATRVVVLWSSDARQSHWVRDEARLAQETGKLSPLIINGARPPLGFQSFHSPSFDEAMGEFDNFLTDLGLTPPPRHQQDARSRGADNTAKVRITIEDAVKGAVVRVHAPTAKVCPTCRGGANRAGCHVCNGKGLVPLFGTSKLQTPPGAGAGMQLRIPGAGDESPDGGPAGDLYAIIELIDGDFRAEGRDLVTHLYLASTESDQSAETELPNGRRIRVKIRSGMRFGQRLRIAGQGLPAVSGQEDRFPAGDLFVELAPLQV